MGTERELYWTRRGVLACQSSELGSIEATQHATCAARLTGATEVWRLPKLKSLDWHGGGKGKQNCQWVVQNAKEGRRDCNDWMKRLYRQHLISYTYEFDPLWVKYKILEYRI